jgi:endoglucanase
MRTSTLLFANMFVFAGILFSLFSCQNVNSKQISANEGILVNQLGYLPKEQKLAIIKTDASDFKIVDAENNVALEGKTSDKSLWPFSGEQVRVADFSKLEKPGKYKLVAGSQSSYEFVISDTIFDAVAKASVKALYLNRAGIAIDEKFGGKWKRAAGHPDNVVYIHQSAASAKRPEGSVISSPRGWYDAGDYNKYIVNSGITTYTMLLFADLFPEYIKSQNLNIPESANNLPDFLDETLWNLRWMLTMQDPNDGGVYHKLTNLNFDPFVMPDKATEKRYVVMKATPATLDFAAVMAVAARVLKTYPKELPGLADSCLAAAKLAWKWAEKNPSLLYTQPKDVSTGGYGDGHVADEWAWAGTELFISTGEKAYFEKSKLSEQKFDTPSWGSVATLGLISAFANSGKMNDVNYMQKANQVFFDLTNALVKTSQESAYRVSISRFDWGSNSEVANQGLLKMVAYRFSGDKKYISSAISDLDYILGRNATQYCFVTGFGQKLVMNIHHRPAAADGIKEPIPGFLAGGPNLATFDDCKETKRNRKYAALSYEDTECSYSTNEIAINWNAPLAFLTGSIDAFAKGKK